MYDAVIFDLDGTLVDSERLGFAAGRAAFAVLGYPDETRLLSDLVGTDQPTGARIIAARHPGLDMAALDRAMEAAYARALADEGLHLKPGVLDLLALIAVPVAIATSSGRASAWRKLAQSGLDAHFRHVVTLDDVTRPKPDAEPYLAAARLLDVDPARCLAFEDSDIGAAAAHAAGMTVVQVPDLARPLGLHAHHIAPDLLSGARMAGLIS